MKGKRRYSFLALLMVVTLLTGFLAGCGATPAPEAPAEQPTAAQEAPAAQAPAPTEAPAEAPAVPAGEVE